MKIVDRKTFLQMPKGTVFCPMRTYDGYPYVDIEEAYILDDHDSKYEYFKSKIGWMTAVEGYSSDAYFAMADDGEEREYEPFIVDTDVSVNHENTLYAVFSAKEVQSLIDQLQQALIDGYGKHKEIQEDYKD